MSGKKRINIYVKKILSTFPKKKKTKINIILFNSYVLFSDVFLIWVRILIKIQISISLDVILNFDRRYYRSFVSRLCVFMKVLWHATSALIYLCAWRRVALRWRRLNVQSRCRRHRVQTFALKLCSTSHQVSVTVSASSNKVIGFLLAGRIFTFSGEFLYPFFVCLFFVMFVFD